jgi:hypothetical protein
MPAPILGAIGGMLARAVGQAVASRMAAKAAGKAASGTATDSIGGLLKSMGGGTKNPIGQNTRINWAKPGESMPAGVAEAQGPMPLQPTPIQPRQTFAQRSMQTLRETFMGKQTVAEKQPPPPVTTAAASNGQTFGDLLGGKITPQQAQDKAADGTEQAEKVRDSIPQLGNAMALLKSGISGPTGVIGVFVGLAVAGKKLADGLYDSNKALALYNGTIGQAYAMSNLKQIRRNYSAAGATSESATALVGAVDTFRDEIQPIKNMMSNLGNTVGRYALNIMTVLVKGFGIVTTLYELIWGETKKNPQANMAQTWINDLSSEYRRDFNNRQTERRKGGTGGRNRRKPGETVG